LDANIFILGLYGITCYVIDGLLWGTTGCFIFRAITGTHKNWAYGAIIVGAVYFLWDEIVVNQFAIRLGVAFEDPSASALMEGNPFSIDLFDLIVSFGIVILGFWLGQKVLNRVLRTNSLKRQSTGSVTATEKLLGNI